MNRFIEKVKAAAAKYDLVPKIVCFLIALGLWGYISESSVGEEKFRIPLNMENLPKNMTVYKVSNKYISVLVQGRKEQLKTVQLKNLRAVVNLQNCRPGSALYPVQIQRTDIPETIKVEPVQSQVDVTVEMMSVKKVPVIISISGSPAEGYYAGAASVKPDFVEIRGAGSVLDKIDKIPTADISVSGASRDMVLETGLRLDRLSSVEVSDTSVQVMIPVGKDGSIYEVKVPVSVEKQPSWCELVQADDSLVTVNLRGMFDDAAADFLDVRADVSGLESAENHAGKKEIRLPVKAVWKKQPEGLEIISVSPEDVLFFINAKAK